MKANLSRTSTTGLLTLPALTEDMAELVGFSQGGFLYEVTYLIDTGNALRRGASLVNIHVQKRPTQTKGGLSFTKAWEQDPEASLRRFLTRSSQEKDRTREETSGADKNRILTFVSDFTSRVNNEHTTKITKKKDSGEHSPKPGMALAPKGTSKGTTVTTTGALTKGNLPVPVFETNIGKAGAVVDSVEVARVSRDLLISRRLDPGEVAGARTGNVISARRTIGGILPGGRPIRTSFLSPAQVDAVHGTLANGLDIRNSGDIIDPDEVLVVSAVPPDLEGVFVVTETVSIPFQSIGEQDFYLVLELVDRTKVVLSTRETGVPHSKNLQKLAVVSKPPLVRVLSNLNRNTLHISQRDKSAGGVAIYRKEHKSDHPILDSEFSFVERITALQGLPVSFVDQVPNQNPVSYRIIPYDRSGTLSGEYTGVVSQRVAHASFRPGNRPRFVSLLVEETSETGLVTLAARSIPQGVIAVQLLRKNLTAHETIWTRVGSVVQVPGSMSSPVLLVDDTAKVNKTYLYSTLLFFRDGGEVQGSTVAFVENLPVAANLVTTTLTDPQVTRSGNEIDIEFQMRTELVPTNLDLVNQAIKNQDLLLYFREEIESRRKDLQGIVCYQVSRLNLSTGEVEGFVPSVARTFSDRQYGPLNNVSPLVPGNEYQYVVRTWFRNTETMLKDLERDVETTRVGGSTSTHVLTPSKWLHPVTLRDGNLVSETSVKMNYGVTEFQLGTLGSSVRTSVVSFSDELPSVLEVSATRLTRNSIWVSWILQGQRNKVDHFLVCTLTHGVMRSVVGKCHNISDSNRFGIVDLRDSGDHTTLVYEVIPVFYDQTRGSPVTSPKVSL